MKRMIFILLILLISLTGCSGAQEEQTFAPEPPVVSAPAAVEDTPAEPAPASVTAGEPEGFPFEYNGQTIYVGLPAEPIVQALGEPQNYFEAPSCAFEGIDKTYFYSGIELHTFPLNGKDYILAVLFTDDSVETPEGVYLGMELADALAAYGDGYTQNGEQYVYTKGKGTLSFFADNGTVSELAYNYETEG